jgi:hypothetical protein
MQRLDDLSPEVRRRFAGVAARDGLVVADTAIADSARELMAMLGSVYVQRDGLELWFARVDEKRVGQVLTWDCKTPPIMPAAVEPLLEYYGAAALWFGPGDILKTYQTQTGGTWEARNNWRERVPVGCVAGLGGVRVEQAVVHQCSDGKLTKCGQVVAGLPDGHVWADEALVNCPECQKPA